MKAIKENASKVRAAGAALCALLLVGGRAAAQTDPLPSWNDGPAKDDAKREYAYGPATGLPDTKVGAFTQALYDQAKKDGWVVISMKNDWKKIFAFD